MRNPILASKTYTEGGTTYKLHAKGGLHFIKGNRKPYFSLTVAQYRKRPNGSWAEGSFGAAHDLILAHFPQFADLAALHLSDIDGAPTHTHENGWYFLAGCYADAFGERYHYGNSDKYDNGGKRHPTGDECLEAFARYVRLPLENAAKIRDSVRATAMKARDDRRRAARNALAALLEEMRPRWQRDADACIDKHGLKVFGDAWEGS